MTHLRITRVQNMYLNKDQHVIVVYEVLDENSIPYYPTVDLTLRDEYSVFGQITAYVQERQRDIVAMHYAKQHAEFYVGQEWTIKS